MDRQTAAQLISNTFNFPFDEGRFRNFVINLLNDVDEEKAVKFRGHIKHSFIQHIKAYRRLGTYTDPNGEKTDVLVVQLKNEWALERSRTMLRNFTSDYLKNRDEKDAALVAYYTTNPDDWRFSYIRMEYKREKTESGKFKIKQDITPAKRYSFLVGKNEPNHTAQSQLISILEDDRNNPTLSALENAFSVDAVTKQFYKDYRAQFEKLWNELNDIVAKDQKIAEEFETKTIDPANFAKKLMGQIVFLYFLQKKGWLGVGKDEHGNFKKWGTGPKNFLRRLFDKEFTDYGNFFNDVLEPLFYEGLASEHDDDYFSVLDCKVPFLNGGLFEPMNGYNWRETDIRIDNDLIADVFKTFDQYNFTVREDEPLEKEVAVDPEMLGKVFENLLPENLRKGKGAYYTPRTIVHYMCQESLINYLDTEVNTQLKSFQEIGKEQLDALGNEPIKGQLKFHIEHRAKTPIQKQDIETLIREGNNVLEYENKRSEELAKNKNYQGKYSEPAISVAVEKNAQDLDDALANIKVCDPAIGSGAFPVGMLNEIVKARTVLSLYLSDNVIAIRQPAEKQSPTNEIASSPQAGIRDDRSVYQLKRHCIQNSLYGVDIDPGAIEIAKLRLWLSLVVDEDDYEEIQPLPNLDYKIMQGNSLIEEFHGISLDIEKKPNEQFDAFAGGKDLDALIEDLHQKQDDFFNAEHPREKKKKRNAVESAIYNIFHNELEKKKNISPQEANAIETDLKEMTHGNKERNFFPWKLYFADVFREKGGFDVVIANPPYKILTVNNTNSSDLEFYKNEYSSIKNSYSKNIYTLFIEKGISINKNSISYIVPEGLFKTRSYKNCVGVINNTCKINFITYFSEMVFENAVTGNLVFLFSSKNIKSVKTAEYIFDDKLNLNPLNRIENSVINKLITSNYPRLEDLCNTFKGMVVKNRDLNVSEIKDSNADIFLFGKSISKWAIKKLFYTNYYDLTIIGGTKKKSKHDTFPRILIRRTGDTLVCALLEYPALTESTLYSCWGKNENIETKYIFALLNSSLYGYFVHNQIVTNQQAFPQILLTDIKELPLPNIQLETQKPFIDLVNQILTAKKANPQADTTALEAEIDQLVYELYGLTEEEIKIVEESVQ